MKNTNLKFLYLLSLSFIFSFLVCCKSSSNEQEFSNKNTQIEEKKTKIKSETAINIARGYLIFDYDFHHCDPIVTEQSAVWFVNFQPKEKYQNCPSAWIDKETGEILNMKIPK